MRHVPSMVLGLVAVLSACTSKAPKFLDRPPEDLLRSAAQFYDAYGKDLQAHRQGKLAQYYHPNGAIVVVAGRRQHYSHATLDSIYRGSWQGPAYFSWDTLAFDSLSPGIVLVTGRFSWLASGATDTSRFIYAALLQAVDSGLAITFEHETPAPVVPK
jgi:hypothetical protein